MKVFRTLFNALNELVLRNDFYNREIVEAHLAFPRPKRLTLQPADASSISKVTLKVITPFSVFFSPVAEYFLSSDLTNADAVTPIKQKSLYSPFDW